MSKIIFNTMCVIGVGLIGGSFARAAKAAGVVTNIVGVGRDETKLQYAKDLGVLDTVSTNSKHAVSHADVIVIATPVGVIKSVLTDIAGFIPATAVITDVGSTKTSVINDAISVFGFLPQNFIPAHPIAGIEKSGVEASFVELFQQRRVILTPQANSDPTALQNIKHLWQACGAKVAITSAEQHDSVLAASSHLPHMLAYTLVDSLASMENKQEIFDYAAGGFKDFTRIASSDPDMWSDICLANKHALLTVLDQFSDDLTFLRNAIELRERETIRNIFSRAKQARDVLCDTLLSGSSK